MGAHCLHCPDVVRVACLRGAHPACCVGRLWLTNRPPPTRRIDADGTIRTGPGQICLAGADCRTSLPMPPATAVHAATRYAYAATVVGSNLNRLCAAGGSAAAEDREAACAACQAAVGALRAKHPLTRWDDASHGRSAVPPQQWP